MASIVVYVVGGGEALTDCVLVAQIDGVIVDPQFTDDGGFVEFELGDAQSIDWIHVQPSRGFWDRRISNVKDHSVVELVPIEFDRPTEWWHEAVGILADAESIPTPITIGVVDSGCALHPHLPDIRRVGAWRRGRHVPDDRLDLTGHGTHVCGLIGSNPGDDPGFLGVACGARIVAARVFDRFGEAYVTDIALAIDYLIREGDVDLINLSLGVAQTATDPLGEAILDAFDAGVGVVAAVGNDAGPVMFPASMQEVIAVSGLGRVGWGAVGSRAAMSAKRSVVGDAFVPAFCCFGPEVDCCAPAVGIVSTAPPRSEDDRRAYVAMNGTSMATPIVTATLARALASDVVYLEMPRTRERAEYACAKLRSMCRDMGFEPTLSGRGLVRLPEIA